MTTCSPRCDTTNRARDGAVGMPSGLVKVADDCVESWKTEKHVHSKGHTASDRAPGRRVLQNPCACPSPLSPDRSTVCFRPSCPSLPPLDPRSESRAAVAGTPPFKQLSGFSPGALVPVRVMLSRSIFTYSAPSAPVASTSRFHRHGLYGMPSLCVQLQRLGDQRVVPCFR